MAKWYGKIGFADTVEQEPGLWVLGVTERSYFGDLISNNWKRQNSGGVNDDINIAHSLSILADPYAVNHCCKMVYAEIMNERWKITNIEIQYPRLILTVGGVYNGNSP